MKGHTLSTVVIPNQTDIDALQGMNSLLLNAPQGGLWTFTDAPDLDIGWYADDYDVDNDTIIDLSANHFDIDCSTTAIHPFGGPPLLEVGVGGQPTLNFDTGSKGGGFDFQSGNYPFGNSQINDFIPYTLCGVVDLTTLGSADYFAMLQLAGASPALSVTWYFTGSSFSTTWYWQLGNGTCDIIGNITAFDAASPFSYIWTYDGSGNRTNPASYTLKINNVPITLKYFSSGGGNVQFNWLGNQGDSPNIAPGKISCFAKYHSVMSAPNQTGFLAMVASKYGL